MTPQSSFQGRPRMPRSRNHSSHQRDKLLASTLSDSLAPKSEQTPAAFEKKASAGAKWFNMPKTNLTPELKRDLQLIKMRNVLDPHRHYKKESAKAPPPEFSQVGTLVEGPTEFYSSRLQNSQRKRTLVEEVLEAEQESGRFKRKYGEIQMAKTSGRKGHYKAQMAKKYGNGAKNIRR
ncbi:hypothetical protein FH972_023682 [Carpinus fangiana]|uniref:Fcf2 pre-rRNA processing C-terminal domain-containing protein n=1 Tax=Carpinus fangiana TaxID=176857 RepID=A0A5N6KWI1_9ROSI|nr:hypothetical protein FH972_023682 [Carpinus fangiana]